MRKNHIFKAAVLGMLLLFGLNLQARHIIGGVMTYECLGGNNYRFTLKMYRDCYCTMCADFDPVAYIAVYRCGSDVNCGSLGQFNYFQRINVPLSGPPRDIEEPDYPCLIPPDICVEEGLYVFNLNLPQSEESYHISYQRCCRNITINNIVNPENSGATFTVEITPEAQQLCNSSPVFNDFPPTVICAGAPLVFDHSATDPDGDQLVYELCSPLLGGGPLLDAGNYETCFGANPNPACPPPYNPVTFTAPTYTALQPMGGDPVISIDPFTGVITGVPTVLGQFVVGVCVSEYRNGVLLSRISRDFQFNVAPCDPTVVADIQEDAIIDGQLFVINSCGNNSVTFVNQSFQERFISFWEWSFDIGGQTQTFNQWSPTVTFPGVGQYEGQLVLNPNTACGDTARIFVNVFPEIEADFSFEYDTCVAGPVIFTDESTTGSCCLTNWEWNFGDGNSSSLQHPMHSYMIPGEIPVTLTVTDTNQCQDQLTQIINYFPVPALIVVAPSAFEGCVPQDVFFNNLSFPIDETYDIFWNFGDGGTGTDISPTHTYTIPGVYTVSVDITSPIGCRTDTTFFNLITMLPSPEAGFDFSPDQPSNLEPIVTFFDESSGAIRWLWDFGNGATSILQNPVYTYPDTGRYEVMQVVTHPSGCMDTLIRILDVRPEVRYFLPNAFTPNNDSVNDTYLGVGVMEGATNFRMTIWNRWGERIFETTDYNEGWNGRMNNTGRESPNGVYIVLVTFTGPRGEKYEIKGFATVVR
jgi:gliding motility-associated-like protein